MTQQQISFALAIAKTYGGIDGDHHKAWVIDQMVRTLLMALDAYELWVADYCEGKDGPDTYEWPTGIAP